VDAPLPAPVATVPATVANARCVDPETTALITSRDPAQFLLVTGLAGEVHNPSSGEQQITMIYLDFGARPPGIASTHLEVPVDLRVPPDARASWNWSGNVLVRPVHDDAPQPEAVDMDWTWTLPEQRGSCRDF